MRREGAGIEAVEALHAAAEPRRQELVRRLNLAPGGTAALVRMREELLRHLARASGTAARSTRTSPISSAPGSTAASWCCGTSTGRRRRTSSRRSSATRPCTRSGNWDDLRNRLEPADRRCYGFFHPQLVDEPLIFVEVALTEAIPDSVAPLLDLDRDADRGGPRRRRRSSTRSPTPSAGLAGVSFGNFLIKQVVEDLKARAAERPAPSSPSRRCRASRPGWRASERAATSETLDEATRAALLPLDAPGWHLDPAVAEPVREALIPVAAHYFLKAKDPGRPSGRPGRALPSRQRRPARAAELPRRHLAERPAASRTA